MACSDTRSFNALIPLLTPSGVNLSMNMSDGSIIPTNELKTSSDIEL